jgi:hypothetical protein
MTAPNDRSNREGILLPHVIECPVCGETAHSFRIRRVTDLLTVDGEFYHRTATCAGSMTLDMPEAMDLANEVHYDEERLRGCNRAFERQPRYVRE